MKKNGKQALRQARRLFRLCRADGALDEDRVRRAVNGVLAAGGRRGAAILPPFLRLVKREQAARLAVVESAAPLEPAVEAALRARLERRHGAGLVFRFVRNEALIGGLRVRVGDAVYDGSVAASLAALAKRLNRGDHV